MQFSTAVGAVATATLIVACRAERTPSAPAEPLAPPTAPPASAPPAPAPIGTTADAAAPETEAPIARRTLRFSAGGGWNAGDAWAALEHVLPAIDRCARGHVAEVQVRLVQNGNDVTREVDSPEGLGTCIDAALQAFVAPPIASPGGRPTLVARFGYFASAADMPPLPEASEHEKILTAPDGSCFGQEKVDCPRNKSCAAPEVRPVLCPK